MITTLYWPFTISTNILTLTNRPITVQSPKTFMFSILMIVPLAIWSLAMSLWLFPTTMAVKPASKFNRCINLTLFSEILNINPLVHLAIPQWSTTISPFITSINQADQSILTLSILFNLSKLTLILIFSSSTIKSTPYYPFIIQLILLFLNLILSLLNLIAILFIPIFKISS